MTTAGTGRCPLAIADPDARFRRHLATALRGRGFEVVDAAIPVTWAAAAPGRALVVTVAAAADWRSAARAAGAGVKVICLLSNPAPVLYVRAYRSGAAAAMARVQPVDDIADGVQQALDGDIVVPLAALRLLAAAAEGDARQRDELADDDRRLLQQLADGATAWEMAARRGVSERTLYRRLGRLYERLQVRGRREAVQLAVMLGVVRPSLGVETDLTDSALTHQP